MTGLCIMCMIYTKKQAVQNNEIIVTKNLLINIVLFLCLICVYNLFKFTVSFGQSLLGLQFLNSNKSGEMADILRTLQNKYIAKTDAEILHPTILHGDQLTEERVHNVQWTSFKQYCSGMSRRHRAKILWISLKNVSVWGQRKSVLFSISDRCKLGYMLNKETIKQYYLPYLFISWYFITFQL